MPPATPSDWARSLTRPPELKLAAHGVELCAWSGTSPVMPQPRLDRHYMVMHLGGAKRVTRRREGPARQVDVAEGSITIVPQGSRFDWVTEGPIAFAHLYLAPAMLDSAIDRLTRRDPRTVRIVDAIGVADPRFSAAMRRLLACGSAGETGLAFETALEDVLAAGMARATTAGTALQGPVHLPRPRLRRVLDHVEDRLGETIRLDELAGIAGLSKFHFARAFRSQTGRTPHGHVMARRMAHARHLLTTTELGVEQVAERCGYASHSRFTATFRRFAGVSPSELRRG